MHTLLITQDNEVITTQKEAIMQREKLVNKLQILTPKMYEDIDMSEFDLVMSYILPISKETEFKQLILADDEYKEDYLKYELPVDTYLTKENGDVEIIFTFMRTYLDPDTGENIQQVRNIKPTSIHICQLSDWLVVPDEAINHLAELYLTNKNLLNGLEQLTASLYDQKIDDLEIDTDTKKLYGTANGVKKGKGVSLEELNNELVEIGAETTGNVKIQKI